MRALGFERKSFTRMARIVGIWGIGGIAAAALALTPSPAQAKTFLPTPRDVHRRVVHDVRRVLEIPRTIHSAHVNAFRSFYRGNTYYAPHHHYHATYRYPVYAGGHVSYHPYDYCNDALFIGGGVPVPHIYVSVRPGGYYYAPYAPYPPPPPPAYYGPGPYRYDDRGDHGRYDDHDRYGDRDDRYGHDDRYDDNDRYDDRDDERDDHDDRYDH